MNRRGAGTLPVLLGVEALKRKGGTIAIRSVGGQGVPDVIHASLMPWK